MSTKYFELTKKANKDISKLPLAIQNKIDNAFSKIKENPLSGKKLRGKLNEYYKFRVGDYRIVYRFYAREKTVFVVKIEHRQGVYK